MRADAVQVELRAHAVEGDAPLHARPREHQRAAGHEKAVGVGLALPLLEGGEGGGDAAVGAGDEERGHGAGVCQMAGAETSRQMPAAAERAPTTCARRAACYTYAARRGGGAVHRTGLENRQRRKSFVGSNPTPSATLQGKST